MNRWFQRKQLALDWPAIFLVFCVLLIAFVGGLLASFGSKLLDFLMLGSICGLAILAVRPFPMIAALAIVACLVVGQLMYFARINQAIWIPYGLGILLFFRIPDAYLKSPFAQDKQIPIPLMMPVLAFIGLTVVSAVLNWTSPLQAIVGGKNLVALWSVYIIIVLFAVTAHQVERVIQWLLPLALLQVPFVLYQFFFVAANRSTQGGTAGLAWDAVTGSFGGNPEGGGASGVMAFALVSAILLVIALWRQQKIDKPLGACVLVASLVCIAMAEIKIVLILFPLGILVLFFRELMANPVRLVAGIIVSVAFVIGILYAYENLHYATSGRASSTLGDLLDRAFGYSFDPNLINFRTGEMGRLAALVFWWQEGFLPNIVNGLLGYGPGASRVSTVAFGDIAQQYPFRIDRSAAAQILWELGLLGFMLFAWILAKATYMAWRLAEFYKDNAIRKACLQTVSAMLAMLLVMSAYGKDLLEVPAMTFFAMLCLGYVARMAAESHPRIIASVRGET